MPGRPSGQPGRRQRGLPLERAALWKGSDELEALWASPLNSEITVVIEPTRNASSARVVVSSQGGLGGHDSLRAIR